jgi:hypothetical protein
MPIVAYPQRIFEPACKKSIVDVQLGDQVEKKSV